MLSTSAAAPNIDRRRIGFYGFSRGYTGLGWIGSNPDWAGATEFCQRSSAPPWCEKIRRKEFPVQALAHDPRIKAAVIADPFAVFFTDASLAVNVPVQLWASEFGGDGVTDRQVATVDNNLPAEHEYHVVPNSGHFAFLAPCPPALAEAVPEICTDAPGFDRAAFHRQFNTEVVRFFRLHLVDR
jgi:predicted dienelactone hydrolase